MSTPLDQKSLEELDATDLRLLIEDQVSECKTIDYKRTLPGRTDADRREFLHDVSSFANASGGHLLFGMKEERGIAMEILGLRDINPDQEITRLEEMLRSGLRPRIYGLQMKAVLIEEGSWVLVLRIPRSWNPPHQVTFQSDMRFSARGLTGKYLMDVDELRSTLEVSDVLGERARNFRLERIAKVKAGETPSEEIDGAHIVLHLLPLSAFTGKRRLDFARGAGHWPFDPPPFMGSGFSSRYCFEGYAFTSGYPKVDTYRLYFRSGAMEYVDFRPSHIGQNDRFDRMLPSTVIEKITRQNLEHALITAKTLELEPPAFLSLSMAGAKGWIWAAGDRFLQREVPFDRDPLLFSEQFVESFDGDIEGLLKALVDPVWHAAGWEQSPNFIEGKWAPDHR
ncbi:helix-turn-helix domain-containing protein [Geothrix edaphica]|uniref:Schlafen AlbA-2 domain-containing protein n=1 Tax=Geothrix edaphica TaxID=2927976 RepID=A0ABQ5PUG4_9BACT|nr:ATP-binding protein [Geothrix edaphica]GLH65726.1 hypothetical protein GETHED_00900 [Geothrix edaphica]